MLIAARQGLALRQRVQPDLTLSPALAAMQAELNDRIALVDEDRALDRDLQNLLTALRTRAWRLYD
jgi:histidine ammonia-lyase